MIKPYHLLISLLIGFGIGVLVFTCGGKEEPLEDPQIGHLKQEIGWREFKEAKIKDTLKIERATKLAYAKEVIDLRAKANRAEAKFREAAKAIPLTHKDTIVFLMRDTLLCDSALTQSKELVAGLTIEIITDNAIIKNLDSLNLNLNADKKDLIKIDSIHIQTEKRLRKANRKKFFKGLGVGGVIGVILTLLF